MRGLQYAALAPGGEVLGVEHTPGHALELVQGRHPDAPTFVDEVADTDLTRNATPPTQAPERALASSGLPVVSLRDVKDMSLTEAHRRLLPYLPARRFHEGRWMDLIAYQTWQGTADRMLGGNFKMNKHPPGDAIDRRAQGLALLPAAYLKSAFFLERQRLAVIKRGANPTLTRQAIVSDPTPGFKSFCWGSNAACRETCLVITGQNESDAYNAQRKMALSNALLHEPEAFVRLLQVACARWLGARGRIVRYARLNVFSDIPWELVAPWLFSDADGPMGRHGGQFYDYTKIPGRRPPPNYDLTFSFSGTNDLYAKYELERGTRVAVVFLLPGTNKMDRYDQPLPKTFWGRKVIDGDDYDMRPLDPGGVIVGLRWKPPNVVGTSTDPTRALRSGFVVRSNPPGAPPAYVTPVYEVDGHLVAAMSARAEPGDLDAESEYA